MQYFIDNGWRVATENSNNVKTETFRDQNRGEISQEAVATVTQTEEIKAGSSILLKCPL